jgi:DNA mismatch repair protein MutS
VAVRPLADAAADGPPPAGAGAIAGAPKGDVAQALQGAVQRVQHYAAATQKRSLGHLAAPRYYALDDYLIMDEATRQSLELTASSFEGRPQGSLFAHLNRTKTNMGARLLRHWLLLPLRSLTRIAQRADAVAALCAHRLPRQRLQEALTPIKDLERLAGRVALGRATPRDVQALGQSLQALPHVRAALGQIPDERLARVARQWQEADLLETSSARLATALVDDPPVSTQEGGIFAKGFDAALDDLIDLATDSQAYVTRFEQQQKQRTGISSLKVRYNRVFGYYIEVSRLASGQVPDDYVRRQTLANAERYVTQELKTFEHRVLEADGRRRIMEAELFQKLIQELCAVLTPLRTLVRLVAQADALAALGEVADKHRYVRPTMVPSATVDLKAARHALVEVMLPGGEPFVPNDVQLDGAQRSLMLVTGPNMAGKSTLMRQVALCAIMAQMGGFVPAASATLGVCDRLYTRVGAQDNLSRGQSTFMVEMMETANILHHATAQSLVLLDEIGRGTSTFDGLSIAWAVAEHLHDVNGCRTLFATHYHELTELTRSHRRAVAMQVTAKEINGEVVFLRALQEGGADRSYGIEVARLARMPESVLRRAKEVLTVLETGADAPAAPSTAPQAATAPKLPQRRQLGLFGAAAPVPAEPAAALAGPGPDILAELGRTSVNHLTPMQALKLVHAWHERLAAHSPGASVHAPGRRRRARPGA